MANVTLTTAANFIPEIWSTMILEDLHKNVVLLPLMDRRFEEFGRDGDTIHVPNLSEFTATVRTGTSRTGALTFVANTENVTDIALDTEAYVAFKLDDIVRIQSIIPEMMLYTKEAGRAVAEQIDSHIATTMDANANTPKGADNEAVTELDIRSAKEFLDEGNVDPGDRYLVVSPSTYSDLYNIDRYTNQLYAGSLGNLVAGKSRGFMGTIMEFDVYMTTNLPAGTNGRKNFMGQKEWIAFVMQLDIAVTVRDPHDELATAVRVVAEYGRKEMRATNGIEIDGR